MSVVSYMAPKQHQQMWSTFLKQASDVSNDNYLLVSPTEFKDVTSAQRQDFSEEQLELITQVIKMDAEQSRRIDTNPKALLPGLV